MRIIVFFIFSTLVCGCSLSGIEGNGNIVIKEGPLAPFTTLKAGGNFLIDHKLDSSFSYQLQIDDNLVDYVNLEGIDNTLMVRTSKRVRSSQPIKLIINSPFPNHIDIAGAIALNGHDYFSNDSLRVSISGACSATLKLNVAHLHTAMSGSSRMDINGNAQKHRLDMAGSSKIDALNLSTELLNVQIGGASLARVNVSKTINAKPSGAARVEYLGNASINADDAQNIFIHPYKP